MALTHLLLQAFMWLAMEPPGSMSASAIVARKVELLRAVKPLSLADKESVFLGQFGARGNLALAMGPHHQPWDPS